MTGADMTKPNLADYFARNGAEHIDLANCIRALSIDAVEAANSGDLPLNFHPAGTGALWVDTPVGAGGATDGCAELSGGAARGRAGGHRASSWSEVVQRPMTTKESKLPASLLCRA